MFTECSFTHEFKRIFFTEYSFALEFKREIYRQQNHENKKFDFKTKIFQEMSIHSDKQTSVEKSNYLINKKLDSFLELFIN